MYSFEILMNLKDLLNLQSVIAKGRTVFLLGDSCDGGVS